MSLGKFLRNLIHSIGHFFSGLAPELKKAISIGVDITNKIKEFDLNHPQALDILTAIIPGDWDDKLKSKFREFLPKIMIELNLVGATVNASDPNAVMQAAIKALQQIDSDFYIKEGLLNSLAIVAAQVASDNKLDWDDAAYLLKWYYDHKSSIHATE